LGEVDCAVDAIDNSKRAPTHFVDMLGHEVAQRSDAGPARQRIVADVQNAARFQLATDKVDDDRSVVVRDPAPYAMQAYVVEIRQVAALGKCGEGLVAEVDLGRRGCGELAGKRHLRGIEVRAVPLDRQGGRVNVDAQSLAEAELAGGLDVRRGPTPV